MLLATLCFKPSLNVNSSDAISVHPSCPPHFTVPWIYLVSGLSPSSGVLSQELPGPLTSPACSSLATLQFVGPSCLTQFCPHKGEITSERKMGLKSLRGSSSISPTSNSGQKEVFHWLPETGIMFINCYIHRETGMTLG